MGQNGFGPKWVICCMRQERIFDPINQFTFHGVNSLHQIPLHNKMYNSVCGSFSSYRNRNFQEKGLVHVY